MRKDIKKVIDRVDFDKTIDSCGFEFADGYSCTFDNIATCYDDRLKLSAYVEQLQQENQSLKDKLYKKQDKLNKIIDYVDCPRFSDNFENMANENNVRKEIIEILKGDK